VSLVVPLTAKYVAVLASPAGGFDRTQEVVQRFERAHVGIPGGHEVVGRSVSKIRLGPPHVLQEFALDLLAGLCLLGSRAGHTKVGNPLYPAKRTASHLSCQTATAATEAAELTAVRRSVTSTRGQRDGVREGFLSALASFFGAVLGLPPLAFFWPLGAPFFKETFSAATVAPRSATVAALSVVVASAFVMVVKSPFCADPAHDDSSLRLPGNAR
jgi:hypothetical protein